MENQINEIGLVITMTCVLIVAIITFFLIERMAHWIERGQYNRDKKTMNESAHYSKWHKYDFDG